MERKILITGAAGNIGYEFQKKMLGKIVLLDKKPISYKTDYEKINIDLADEAVVNEYFKDVDFDVIIHLAAVSRVVDAEKNIKDSYLNNVKIIENIITALIVKKKLPHFIFSSSREIYGNYMGSYYFNESSSCNPINVYGKTKLAAEEILKKYSNMYNLPITILRFSNVYGGENDNNKRFLPNLIKCMSSGGRFLLNDRDKKLDFVHIDDVVFLVSRILEVYKPIDGFSIYNIASGKAVRLIELLEICEKSIDGFEYDISSGETYEVKETAIDNSKIVSEFNYKFKDVKQELLKLISNIKKDMNKELKIRNGEVA